MLVYVGERAVCVRGFEEFVRDRIKYCVYGGIVECEYSD